MGPMVWVPRKGSHVLWGSLKKSLTQEAAKVLEDGLSERRAADFMKQLLFGTPRVSGQKAVLRTGVVLSKIHGEIRLMVQKFCIYQLRYTYINIICHINT